MTQPKKKGNLISNEIESFNLSTFEQKEKEISRFPQKEAEKDREKSCFEKKEKGKEEVDCLSMVLAKNNRLGAKNGIKEVFKKGKTLNSEFFAIRYVFGESGSKKFGISASSRFFKKAVKRNLVRRRLGEIIRKNLSRIRPGLRAVIVVKKDILAEESRKIEKDLLEGLAGTRTETRK